MSDAHAPPQGSETPVCPKCGGPSTPSMYHATRRVCNSDGCDVVYLDEVPASPSASAPSAPAGPGARGFEKVHRISAADAMEILRAQEEGRPAPSASSASDSGEDEDAVRVGERWRRNHVSHRPDHGAPDVSVVYVRDGRVGYRRVQEDGSLGRLAYMKVPTFRWRFSRIAAPAALPPAPSEAEGTGDRLDAGENAVGLSVICRECGGSGWKPSFGGSGWKPCYCATPAPGGGDDDPEADGTDFAHPAYLRGERDASAGMLRALHKLLDTVERGEKRAGRFGDPETERLAQRIEALGASPPREGNETDDAALRTAIELCEATGMTWVASRLARLRRLSAPRPASGGTKQPSLTVDQVGPALRRVLDRFGWIDIHRGDLPDLEPAKPGLEGGSYCCVVDALTEELNRELGHDPGTASPPPGS